MAPEIILEICHWSRHKYLYRRTDLISIAQKALVYCNRPKRSVIISMMICDDNDITRLNQIWRKKNGPTDVLAFPAAPVPGSEPELLGDIAISFETVMRRQQDDRLAARREIRLLFCHGMLHLLGMDHETDADRAAMQKAQAHILGISEEEAWIADDVH